MTQTTKLFLSLFLVFALHPSTVPTVQAAQAACPPSVLSMKAKDGLGVDTRELVVHRLQEGRFSFETCELKPKRKVCELVGSPIGYSREEIEAEIVRLKEDAKTSRWTTAMTFVLMATVGSNRVAKDPTLSKLDPKLLKATEKLVGTEYGIIFTPITAWLTRFSDFAYFKFAARANDTLYALESVLDCSKTGERTINFGSTGQHAVYFDFGAEPLADRTAEALERIDSLDPSKPKNPKSEILYPASVLE